jgi:DNA-binding transcriptional ArsR family regulator
MATRSRRALRPTTLSTRTSRTSTTPSADTRPSASSARTSSSSTVRLQARPSHIKTLSADPGQLHLRVPTLARQRDTGAMAGRKKGKFQQTVRVLPTLEELRLHHAGLTVQELAEHFEITTRQVRRDLAVLEEAGHALDMDAEAGEGTRVRLLDVPLKAVQLSLRERYALLAVRRVFDVLERTPRHEDVRSVYAKIARGMPSEHAQLDERFVYLPDRASKLYARKSCGIVCELHLGVMNQVRPRRRSRA